MEMAGYGKISATSYLLTSGDRRIKASFKKGKPTYKCFMTHSLPGADRKLYIPIFINKFRIVGCVDTGSDMTILHMSYFKKIFKNTTHLSCDNLPSITTYSDHTLPIKGKINTLIKLSRNHAGIPVMIYIVEDIQNVPAFLLGTDFLKAGLGMIAYSGSVEDPYPEVIFSYPTEFRVSVYHESPRNLFSCIATCILEPYEIKSTDFFLSQAAPIVRTDHILITGHEWDTISIIPSRSDVEYVACVDKYVATGCVANLSDKVVKCHIQGKYELINNYNMISVQEDNMGQIRHAVQAHPLGREVLMAKATAHIHVPLMTVNHLAVSQTAEAQVSDLDFADTIMNKEPTYFGEAEIKPEIIEPSGLDLPTIIYKTAAEAIDLSSYSEEVKPYIKDIFIDKYPEVVALHSLDAGNLSLTLGSTQLRLREGEVLPRSKRIFHVSPSDQRHLDDICDLLIKFGYIMRSPMSPNGCHLYGMSAYLVPRSKPNCLGRLIVDFSPVNQLIQSPSAVIPEISATLQFLQGKALYTSLDLKYAYLSLRIDEESRKLTTFLTPTGSFQWLSLPTGAANSPAYFTDACNRILHFEPLYDEEGNLIYESENVVKQKRSVLKDVCNYFDDILITSPLKPTYGETLHAHFETLEKTIKRLAFHGAKISVMKCEFAKSKILFLGWYICHNYVIADPRRIQKVKDFKFPDSKKSVRAFLGLVNSLRRVVNLDVIKQVAILTPLTSSKNVFMANDDHRKAFEQIKVLLTQEPLFGNLIDETADKYLWVDAATSSGVLGAVLAQKTFGKQNEKVVPDFLDLDDEIHRIIFDKELPYEPVTLYTNLPILLPKPSVLKTVPPKITIPEKLLGFSEENYHESFFWSTISILALYGCTIPKSTLELRQLALKKLKAGILNNKLKDFTFNLNYNAYKAYLDDFSQGNVAMDPELFLAEALASGLHRPMTFISSLPRHKDRPIFHFNHDSDKPPLIYGIYLRDNKEIFLPFFHNKHTEFKLDHLKGKIQVVAYVAKTIPETFKSRPILDLEVFAILTALYSLQRFISGVKVQLLTDSRVLFYLFSSKVGNSCVKIRRWCLKLISDYPLVILHFVRTTENLADFLTREGLPPGDLQKFNLQDVVIRDFYDELPKVEFSLIEWVNFVEDHPEYLTVNTPTPDKLKAIALSINKGLENVQSVLTPLEILKNKFSRAAIISAQKQEFEKIYTLCLASKDFTLDIDLPTITHKYKLVSDLLMIYEDYYKIYVPNSLIGILLSYTHLLGHKGLNRMLADMQSYYFENMYTVTSNFIQCCYSCFLTNKGNKKTKIGIYPTPSYPFEEITLDLAESLNSINGFSHLLIIQCVFSEFVIIIPLRTKSASEVSRALMNSVFQQFNVRRLHSDNGPCFRSAAWLETMAAFNIQVIASAALHPSGRGQIERLVGIVKLMLKRMLAIQSSLNWEYFPFLCAKIMNNMVSPKTTFKPQEMVFGSQGAGVSFLDTEKFSAPHYLVKNNQQHIDKLTAEIQEMTKVATERLTHLRLISNEKINKNRIVKDFKPNDYVFVLDRLQVAGNTRPLKTRYHPSPYIVIRPLWTTTLVRRLSDGYTTLYSNNDIKKYDKSSPLFNNLPPVVTRVLLHSFEDLLDSDLATLTENDNFELPNGITLFNPSENDIVQDDNVPKLNMSNFDNQIQNTDFPQIPDEFEPEEHENINIPNVNVPTVDTVPPPVDTVPDNIPITDNNVPSTDDEEQVILDRLGQLDRDQLVQELLEIENNVPKEQESHSEDSEEEQEIINVQEQHNTQNTVPLRRGTRIRKKKVQFV
jgi:hypothetical protein